MKLTTKPVLHYEITLSLTEQDCFALDAISGYDIDAFITNFYQGLGTAYLKPQEDNLRSLMKNLREIMPGVVSKINNDKRLIVNDEIGRGS